LCIRLDLETLDIESCTTIYHPVKVVPAYHKTATIFAGPATTLGAFNGTDTTKDDAYLCASRSRAKFFQPETTPHPASSTSWYRNPAPGFEGNTSHDSKLLVPGEQHSDTMVYPACYVGGGVPICHCAILLRQIQTYLSVPRSNQNITSSNSSPFVPCANTECRRAWSRELIYCVFTIELARLLVEV